MELLKNEDGTSYIRYDYPMAYSSNLFNRHVGGHEEMAAIIAEQGLKTYMIITAADMLADEHWENPDYLHKTNHIIICKAREEARKDLTNKYFNEIELGKIFAKRQFPLKEFNYKDDEGRQFSRRIEDELYSYQEMTEVVKLMCSVLESAKYKMDEEGYLIEDDDENYILETDEAAIEKNKEILLEEYLIPRIYVKRDRIYNMPEPLIHWDSRSPWHQTFYLEIPAEGITLVSRGGCGSSGAREENGRWAHVFGLLASKYASETQTFFMKYDANNCWKEEFRLDTFATISRDLSGNYYSTREVMAPIFTDRTWDLKSEGHYNYSFVKSDKDYYY